MLAWKSSACAPSANFSTTFNEPTLFHNLDESLKVHFGEFTPFRTLFQSLKQFLILELDGGFLFHVDALAGLCQLAPVMPWKLNLLFKCGQIYTGADVVACSCLGASAVTNSESLPVAAIAQQAPRNFSLKRSDLQLPYSNTVCCPCVRYTKSSKWTCQRKLEWDQWSFVVFFYRVDKVDKQDWQRRDPDD